MDCYYLDLEYVHILLRRKNKDLNILNFVNKSALTRTAAATAGGGTNVCNVGGGTTPTSFVISIQLKVQEGAYNYWCVDSTGFMGGHNAVISGTATACPAS